MAADQVAGTKQQGASSKEEAPKPLLQTSSAVRVLVYIGLLLVGLTVGGVWLIHVSRAQRLAKRAARTVLEEEATSVPFPEPEYRPRRLSSEDSTNTTCPAVEEGAAACNVHDDCFWLPASADLGAGSGWSADRCVHKDMGEEAHIFVPEGILAGFCTLAAGALIMQVFSGIPLPYTVILLTSGMLLGTLVLFTKGVPSSKGNDMTYWDASVVEFQLAINLMGDLDAHLLLHIFLPPLIFESAFAIEWHVFDQLKWYCVILAIPGLVIGTYATGGLLNMLLMPRGDRWFDAGGASMHEGNLGACADDAWSEMSGYLLGVILSATDPVAVVALLKELGVKAELSIGIEGESLLNDGTALVIFAVLQLCVENAQHFCVGGETYLFNDDVRGAILNETYTEASIADRLVVGANTTHIALSASECDAVNAQWLQIGPDGYVIDEHWLEPGACIWKFIYMAVIGGIFGLAMAFILVAWISKVFNDAMVEVTLTLTFAYLTFFLAEHWKMSGVLAVVVLGIYMGKNGRTRISPEVEHFLNEFWELLAYFGNTLIFVIAGIMIVADLGKDCDADCQANLGTDVWQLLVVYTSATLIRGVLVITAYAIMNFSGLLRMPWSDALVATWGGLRGAVGLACAILVFTNGNICENVQRKVMFHTAGICVLTVLVNGVTMRYLIQALGMDKMPDAKAQMFSQALRQIDRAGAKREQAAMKEGVFETVVWEVARKYYVKEEDLREDLHQRKDAKDAEGTVATRASGRRSLIGAGRDSLNLWGGRKSTAASRDTAARDTASREKEEKEAAGIVEVRRRILMRCKQSYWNQLEAGLIQRDAAKYLRRITDICVTEQCSLLEWDMLKASLSERDKWEHDAMKASEAKPVTWRVRLHAFLNTVGWTFFVMLVVIVSVIFGLEDSIQDRDFIKPFEYTVMSFFIFELLLRMISSPSIHTFATDPYCIVDLMVVLLDLGTTFSSQLYDTKNLETLPRLVRVLRTLRLLKGLRLLSASKKGAATISQFQACVNALDRCITYLTQRHSWLSWLLVVQQRMTVGHFEIEHNVVSGFLAAREEAVEMVPQFLGEIHGLEEDAEFQDLVSRLHTDVEKAHAALNGLRQLNPEAYASITTVIAARSVLHRQQKAVKKLCHEGMLDSHEVEHIEGSIEKSMKRLVFSPPYIPLPGSMEVLRQVHWTHALTEGSLQTLLASCEEQHFKPGQVVIEQGRSDDAVYVVKRGTLNKEKAAQLAMHQLHMGHSFNETGWLLGKPSSHTVRAAQEVDALRVPGHVMRQLAEAEPAMNEALWLRIGSEIAMAAITEHALDEHQAQLAPWQLARIMRTIRMHHVREVEAQPDEAAAAREGPLANVSEMHTFMPHATVILVSGSAYLLKKTRLERAGEEDVGADLREARSQSAPDGDGGDGGGGLKGLKVDVGGSDRPAVLSRSLSSSWSLVRRAAEHREDEMVRFVAPDIIPPLEPGMMFRVAFNAESRFACDEDAIYVPPKQSALLRLTNLAYQVLNHSRQISRQKEEKTDGRGSTKGFFGRRSMLFSRNSSRDSSSAEERSLNNKKRRSSVNV